MYSGRSSERSLEMVVLSSLYLACRVSYVDSSGLQPYGWSWPWVAAGLLASISHFGRVPECRDGIANDIGIFQGILNHEPTCRRARRDGKHSTEVVAGQRFHDEGWRMNGEA